MSQRVESQIHSLFWRCLAIFLQFFFDLDMVGYALMLFSLFICYDFGMDDGILFRLDNGTVNTVYDIVRTVLCRNHGIEGCQFTLDGVLQTAVYAMQFILELIDFFE